MTAGHLRERALSDLRWPGGSTRCSRQARLAVGLSEGARLGFFYTNSLGFGIPFGFGGFRFSRASFSSGWPEFDVGISRVGWRENHRFADSFLFSPFILRSLNPMFSQ